MNGLDPNNAIQYSARLTAGDCVELLMASTVTHDYDAITNTWNPKAHPPHAHAHIQKEGFTHTAETNKRQRKKLQTEGLHIDPVEWVNPKNAISPSQRIIDPVNRQGAISRYIDRPRHSQFEDSEIAIMGLFFSLNTEAGQEALDHLVNGGGNRAVITSQSAAYCLKNLRNTIKYDKLKVKATSQNKLRDHIPTVVERQAGSSGKAHSVGKSMAATVTVLDKQGADLLVVTTHYPVATTNLPANIDRVEKRGAHPPNIDHNWRKNQELIWAPEQVCVRCGQQHQVNNTNLAYFYRWHCCNTCGHYYCPNCGDGLSRNGWFVRTRICDRADCGGSTFLVA